MGISLERPKFWAEFSLDLMSTMAVIIAQAQTPPPPAPSAIAMLFPWLFLGLIMGSVLATIAKRKGKNPGLWCFLGLFRLSRFSWPLSWRHAQMRHCLIAFDISKSRSRPVKQTRREWNPRRSNQSIANGPISL